MFYNELQDVVKNPQTLTSLGASIAPFINPVTIISVVALGLVGFAVYQNQRLKHENEQLSDANADLVDEIEGLSYQNEQSVEPLKSAIEAANEPLSSTANNGSLNGANAVENMDDEALKNEMIRQTMSELGRRSAAARAKEKQNVED